MARGKLGIVFMPVLYAVKIGKLKPSSMVATHILWPNLKYTVHSQSSSAQLISANPHCSIS